MRAQAMTSSRSVATIPPCAIPSQPSKRSGSVSATQQRSSAAWSSRCRPCTFSVPQAKQLWGATSIRRPPIRTSATAGSDVKVAHLAGLGLDELLARLDPLAHELGEDLVGHRGVLDLDAEQGPCLRVHRRLPELVGVHLAEALEALDAGALGHLLEDPLAVLLGLRVAGHLARGDPVERRLGDVQVALVDDLR